MVNPRFKLLTSIPVLFHVCRESRAEATKKYIAVFASYDGEDRRSIYLNPKVDTLFIRIPFWNCVWASDTFICDHDRESTTQSDDGNMLPGSDLASRTTVVALNPRRNTAWWKERLVVVVHSEEEFASLIADEEDSGTFLKIFKSSTLSARILNPHHSRSHANNLQRVIPIPTSLVIMAMTVLRSLKSCSETPSRESVLTDSTTKSPHKFMLAQPYTSHGMKFGRSTSSI